MLKRILLLFIILASMLYLWKTNDFHRTLAVFYGLITAIMLNVQGYRLIDNALRKLAKGAGSTLFSLLLGEIMKFMFLWAMLLIAWKGLHLDIKAVIFSFIGYYLFFIVLNMLPEGQQWQKKP